MQAVSHSVGDRKRAARFGTPLLLAVLLTAINVVKPLHIDDTYYYRVAEQIAEHPLDPYGFEMFWYQWPHPVAEEMVNPVVPYWIGLCIQLFGNNPLLVKLGLFPFALCLTWAMFSLSRRFARGLEGPLTWMTALSPLFLPGLNLMLDVPAVALLLVALELFCRSGERKLVGYAIAAGVVAGVAMQTKYPAVIVIPVLLLYAIIFRQKRAAAIAIPIALLLFGLWEYVMTLRYGRGMLVGHMTYYVFHSTKLDILRDLLPLVGATAPAIVLLGIAGIQRWNIIVAAAGVMFAGTFALMIARPIDEMVFVGYGWLAVAVTATVVWQLCRVGRGGLWKPTLWQANRVEWFLTLWLAGEVVTYVIMSPFPAARRVMGLTVVATLLFGRLASLRCRTGFSSRRAVAVISAAGVMLGLWSFLADYQHARAQAEAPKTVADQIRARDPDAVIWFVGHWGFQFYAEEVGMQPLIADVSSVQRGDWVVSAANSSPQFVSIWSEDDFERISEVAVDHWPPVSMIPAFYGNVPLVHRDLPQAPLAVFVARKDVVPISTWDARSMAEWVMQSAPIRIQPAVPALVRAMDDEDAETRKIVINALARIGPPANSAVPRLTDATDDEDPDVREAAARALVRIRE